MQARYTTTNKPKDSFLAYVLFQFETKEGILDASVLREHVWQSFMMLPSWKGPACQTTDCTCKFAGLSPHIAIEGVTVYEVKLYFGDLFTHRQIRALQARTNQMVKNLTTMRMTSVRRLHGVLVLETVAGTAINTGN